MSGPSEKTKRPISRCGTEGTQRAPVVQPEYSLRSGADTQTVLPNKTVFRLPLIILLISLAAIVLNLTAGGIASPSWTRPLRLSCHAHREKTAGLLNKSFLDHLERMRKKWEIAGMVVSVGASPRYTKGDWKQNIWGFGDADSHGKAVTAETMWGIASNSKLFVALSIGLLVDRKTSIPGAARPVLDYDTKVKAVLPWWGLMDAYAEEHLTVLDMLGMRSGLPSHDFYHDSNAGNSLHTRLNTSPRDGLPALEHLRPSAEIRDTWQYNNQHYFTLAEIVSTLSGMPFTDFVQKEIFDPLNMTTTTYNSTVAKESGHRAEAILHHGMDWKACKAYKAGDTKAPEGCLGKKAGFGWWTEGSGVDEAGAGAMVISGNDMAKWIRELLDPQHLPAHLVTRCAEPISVMPLAFGPIDSVWTYGMAQMRTTYRGQTIIMHTGGLPGSLSILMRLPDLGVGLMVATNDDFAGALFFRAAAMSIVDHLIGPVEEGEVEWDEAVMPVVWAESSLTAPPEHPHPPTPSKLGRYYDAAYGYLNFTRADPHDAGDNATLSALRSVHRPLRVDERTHVAHLTKAFVNRLAFTHFDGQLWNWTTLTMFDTPDGRLTSQTQTSGSAIVTEEGIGMFGNYWVAGPGVEVRHAHEGSKREDAEVWYGRIEFD